MWLGQVSLSVWPGWIVAEPTLLVLAAVALALALTARQIGQRRHSSRTAGGKSLDSFVTWWLIAAVVLAALGIGRVGLVVLLWLVSVLAYREYEQRMMRIPPPRAVRIIVYAAMVVLYGWVVLDPQPLALMIVGVGGWLAVAAAMVIRGRTKGYDGLLGSVSIALLLTIMFPALLAVLPQPVSAFTSGAALDRALALPGLVLLLTPINDIAAAHVGKRLGGPRIVPSVSPKKTWSGTIGGVLVCGAVAAGLGPWLTGMMWGAALLLGVIIGVGGFFGDVNMSALKRQHGLDDSGDMLPGQGGILDRIDSLSFTAPLTWIYLYLL